MKINFWNTLWPHTKWMWIWNRFRCSKLWRNFCGLNPWKPSEWILSMRQNPCSIYDRQGFQKHLPSTFRVGWCGKCLWTQQKVQHIKTVCIHVRISMNTYVHIQIDKYIGKSISTYATLPHTDTRHAWNSHRWNGCDRRCPCTGNNNALDLICFKLPFMIICPW